MVVIERIDDLEGLRQLTPSWKALLARSDADPVFLHPIFLQCWWRAFGDHGRRQLHLLVLREGNEIIAIAPLMRKRFPCGLQGLEIISTESQGHGDYGGLIYPRDRPDLLAELLVHLRQTTGWHWLRLRHIPARTQLKHHLALAAVAAKLVMHERHLVDCPFITLPGTYEEMARSLSKSLRYDLRSKSARLKRLGRLDFKAYRHGHEILPLLPDLYEMHIKRWAAQGSVFSRTDYRLYVELLAREFAPTGYLHFSGLFLKDRPIALHLGFATESRFYYYRPAYDLDYASYSPGTILLNQLVESSIVDGVSCFDFLLGDEAYKLKWATDSCPNQEFWLYPDTFWSRLRGSAAIHLHIP